MMARTALGPRMDPTRYTHAYRVDAAPAYRAYTIERDGHPWTCHGLVDWWAEDRHQRNSTGSTVARLIESGGTFRIEVTGPSSVRGIGFGRLTILRYGSGPVTTVWTGHARDGVTVEDAVAHLRDLRTTMQADADGYRLGTPDP